MSTSTGSFVAGDKVSDTGNEHFLVFDGPDGSLMTVWTQSSAEAQPDQHIAFSRSTDEGVTWAKPRIIAGPKRAGAGPIASWAYPLVSTSGRIYVLYTESLRQIEKKLGMRVALAQRPVATAAEAGGAVLMQNWKP